MGFCVEGAKGVNGEARRESFYLNPDDWPRDLPQAEFHYRDIPGMLEVIDQIRDTEYYREWIEDENVSLE